MHIPQSVLFIMVHGLPTCIAECVVMVYNNQGSFKHDDVEWRLLTILVYFFSE